MKKFIVTALALFAMIAFSGLANAKLIKIGTVTMSKDVLSNQQGPGGGFAGGGGTTATGNEFGLIYEDDTNLVWIDYSAGSKEWPDQVDWAVSLNKPGILTYHLDPGVSVEWTGDWRLPDTVDGARKNGYDGTTTAGFNITSSEMGHLFYKSLGNVGYYDTKGNVAKGFAGLKNKGPFKNLNPVIYWSGTQYAIYPNHAWQFNFYWGAQDNISFTNSYSFPGLVVRPAKVVIK